MESAARFLSADPRLEIVDRASSGKEALLKVAEKKPDLVLIDWGHARNARPRGHAPDQVGADARVSSSSPLYDLPEYSAIAKLAFADGFVAKSDFGEKLVPLMLQII